MIITKGESIPKSLFPPLPQPDEQCKPIQLLSTIGRGLPGHSITVEVVSGDPYGFYRLQFKDDVTGEVLETTPNLDPGSRLYLCNKELVVTDNDVYSVTISDFTVNEIDDSACIRIGDVVIFNAKKDVYSDGSAIVDVSGIGIVVNVSPFDIVTFHAYDYISDGIVTTEEIANHSITEEKMSLTMSITNIEIDEIMSH